MYTIRVELGYVMETIVRLRAMGLEFQSNHLEYPQSKCIIVKDPTESQLRDIRSWDFVCSCRDEGDVMSDVISEHSGTYHLFYCGHCESENYIMEEDEMGPALKCWSCSKLSWLGEEGSFENRPMEECSYSDGEKTP